MTAVSGYLLILPVSAQTSAVQVMLLCLRLGIQNASLRTHRRLWMSYLVAGSSAGWTLDGGIARLPWNWVTGACTSPIFTTPQLGRRNNQGLLTSYVYYI